jgi:hypothetical protein
MSSCKARSAAPSEDSNLRTRLRRALEDSRSGPGEAAWRRPCADRFRALPVPAEWSDLSLERQLAVIGAMLSEATVGPARGPRDRFDPERITFRRRA